MSDDKIAPMSQFPQVHRELVRGASYGLFDAEEVRDILRSKFNLPMKDNENYFMREVNIDTSHVAAGYEPGDGLDEEEYDDGDTATA